MEGVDSWQIEDGIEIAEVMEVVVENNIEVDIEDTIENIEDNGDFYHKNLAILVTKMSFEVEVTKFSKVGVCSNYFEVVHKIEILH